MEIPYELLIKHLKGKTTSEESVSVDKWLLDKENHKLFSEFKKEWKYINDDLLVIPNKSEIWEKIESRIFQKKKKSIHKNIFRYVAAIIILAAIISIISLIFRSSHQNIKTEIIEVVSTGTSEKKQIELPDGTTVWLNSNSKLSYNQYFNAELRKVSMEGELFFDVYPSNKKFIIDVGSFEIEVLGTSFNVNAYSSKEEIEINLKEGKIAVVDPQNKQTLLFLEPLQSVNIRNDDMSFTIHEEKESFSDIWKKGSLIIDDEPLNDFILKLEGWYGISISQTGLNPDERFTFYLENESINEFLELFSQITPIDYYFKGDQLFIDAKEKN